MSFKTANAAVLKVMGAGAETVNQLSTSKAFGDSKASEAPITDGQQVQQTLVNGDNVIPVNIGRALTGGIVISQSLRANRVTVTADGNSLVVWTDAGNNPDGSGIISVTIWAY